MEVDLGLQKGIRAVRSGQELALPCDMLRSGELRVRERKKTWEPSPLLLHTDLFDASFPEVLRHTRQMDRQSICLRPVMVQGADSHTTNITTRNNATAAQHADWVISSVAHYTVVNSLPCALEYEVAQPLDSSFDRLSPTSSNGSSSWFSTLGSGSSRLSEAYGGSGGGGGGGSRGSSGLSEGREEEGEGLGEEVFGELARHPTTRRAKWVAAGCLQSGEQVHPSPFFCIFLLRFYKSRNLMIHCMRPHAGIRLL